MAESPRALGKPNTKSTVRTIWGFEELAGGRKLVQRLEVWNRKGEDGSLGPSKYRTLGYNSYRLQHNYFFHA